MAVAESLTGGMLSAALTRAPGASATFRGGMVVYAEDLKTALAGVAQPLLDAHGAVSAEVAAALARGARDRLSADLGLGITGVAGPDPVGELAVGTVFAAVSGTGVSEVSRAALPGSRTEIRESAVSLALGLLAAVLTEPGMPEDHAGVTP